MKLDLTKEEVIFLDDYFSKILNVAMIDYKNIENQYQRDYTLLVAHMSSIRLKVGVLLDDIEKGR